MPTNADRGSDNDIRGILGDIREQVIEMRSDQRMMRQEQERHAKIFEEAHHVVTGGHDPREGLVFQVAQLREETARQKEKNTFWFRALGTTAAGTLITMIAQAFSSTPPKGP